MRAMLLLLVVPMAWTLFWVVLRLLITARLSQPRRQGTVIDGIWRDPDEPVPIRRGPQAPLCGRIGLHGFLRLFGSEDSCRHCAEELKARRDAEHEAAVREAERQLSRRRDEPL